MSNEKKPRLFTPLFTCLLFSQGFSVFAHFIMVISLPLFLDSLGYSTVVIGFLASAMTISTVIMRIIAGKLADLYGRKLIFLLSAALSFLTAFLYYFFSYNLVLLFVLRIISGAASGMSTASSGPLMADIVHKDRLDQAIGLNRIAVQLGTGFGTVICIPLIENYGYSLIFLLVFILCGLSLLLAFLLPMKNTRMNTEKLRERKKDHSLKGMLLKLWSFFDLSALIPASCMIPVYFSYCSIANYLALYAADTGVANISIYFAVNTVCSILAGVNVSVIRKALGFKLMSVTGILAVCVGFALIAFGGSIVPIVIAAVLMAYGMGLLAPSMNAQLFSFAKEERRSTANATYHSVLDLSQALGAMVWGSVVAALGYKSMFAFCAVIPLLGIVLFFAVLVRKQENAGTVENN